MHGSVRFCPGSADLAPASHPQEEVFSYINCLCSLCNHLTLIISLTQAWSSSSCHHVNMTPYPLQFSQLRNLEVFPSAPHLSSHGALLSAWGRATTASLHLTLAITSPYPNYWHTLLTAPTLAPHRPVLYTTGEWSKNANQSCSLLDPITDCPVLPGSNGIPPLPARHVFNDLAPATLSILSRATFPPLTTSGLSQIC